ncbi:hypothetical protein Adt_07091 [Abeliophyllum distichum]|uniref:Uncharacterized protein n=1 Tax=Abeliophyllum distichum TaxID=126358 RepID=A0ABD1V8S3_9LAMI
MDSSFNSTTTPNFDNLLVQSLMGRLQIRPPTLHTSLTPAPPFLTPQSLEELLFTDTLLNFSESDSENESDKTQLAKEESRLEKEIVRTILSGETEKLKPNSSQAVTIGEHHICVGFHEETGSDYRVWEWHGHIMLFDEENGYTPEYIYGNYFERVNAVKRHVEKKKERDDDDVKEDGNGKEREEDKVGNMGLRELIESSELGSSRILHRNLNVNSASPGASVCTASKWIIPRDGKNTRSDPNPMDTRSEWSEKFPIRRSVGRIGADTRDPPRITGRIGSGLIRSDPPHI